MPLAEIDQARLMIGDTDTADALLSDAELTHFIDSHALLNDSGGTVSVNIAGAAADAASAIAAKFAREFDFGTDGQNFSRAQRVGHYQALERELRNMAGGYTVATGGTATT